MMDEANLCLGPNNNIWSPHNTFGRALIASQETGHDDFIKVALEYGAIPCSIKNLFVPNTTRDCVVFGGNRSIRYLHENIEDIIELCRTKTLNHRQIREILETIVCASGSVTMSENYFDQIYNSWYMNMMPISSGKNISLLHEIFNDYHALWSGRYLIYDRNDKKGVQNYQRIIELKQRLSAKTQCIMDQRNSRKTEIEIIMSGLPICCTDIIHGYDDSNPQLDLIDWSKH